MENECFPVKPENCVQQGFVCSACCCLLVGNHQHYSSCRLSGFAPGFLGHTRASVVNRVGGLKIRLEVIIRSRSKADHLKLQLISLLTRIFIEEVIEVCSSLLQCETLLGWRVNLSAFHFGYNWQKIPVFLIQGVF